MNKVVLVERPDFRVEMDHADEDAAIAPENAVNGTFHVNISPIAANSPAIPTSDHLIICLFFIIISLSVIHSD